MSSPPLALQSILRPRRDVRYRIIDGEAVVLCQEAGEAMVLNEVGARILQLLDGTRSLAAVVAALGEEFEATEDELIADCREFVETLSAIGVLETVTAG